MLSATELDFATRTTGELPGWLTQQKSLRIWPLAEAKTVTLRRRGHNVLVRVRELSSVLVGEISGFEPSVAALDGMYVGDLIVFKPAHIFAASQ
jgi:hypothetical protein